MLFIFQKSKDDNAKDKMYAKSLRELREISKNLHKEYVKMKFEAEKRFEELTQLMKQVNRLRCVHINIDIKKLFLMQ